MEHKITLTFDKEEAQFIQDIINESGMNQEATESYLRLVIMGSFKGLYLANFNNDKGGKSK